ncbi:MULTISPECIES: EscU/YscU/HrcU family type III secretion system export apparatus switch protein [Kordiimonas]|mgnify:CR=1 FL=1|uniref:Flagellar biosynthesis protein n=1 Tax=Kordiimonas lacus TaxID=637679 RepID=A0A1G7CMS8_9PROT|nr:MULTISPECIES: EscU/YscU/HrcU family type III secretion system export apparatus switch protein [Kordiimonas]SDE40543.1 flagellar biosynthesis protein [Kordiimonas lacus]
MSDQKPTDAPKPVPDTKAVAVKRDSEQATPRITAKGHGFNAEKILDIAFAEGVKVRQDKDLTELLDAFEVESPVPLEALHAVSLILERVYAENKAMTEAREHDTDTVETTELLEPMPADEPAQTNDDDGKESNQ